MAGQRRAQFVSIPLGPGVLTNTTGRGAHTRVNYMNFDRWTDATWVRWHKLLPEKQGGWQYLNLGQANGGAIPTNSPLLLLHFDGANGQTSTVDSSLYAREVDINTGNSALSTTDPKFGTAALGVGSGQSLLHNYVTQVPFTLGDSLDIFATPNWTIQCWFYCFPFTEYYDSFPIFDYGCAAAGDTQGGDLVAELSYNGAPDNPLLGIYSYNMFSNRTESILNPTPVSINAWHHLALVNNAGTTTAYLDGIAFGTPQTDWNPANYTPPNAVPYISIAGFPGLAADNTGGYIDEFEVLGYAAYTSNFTPPTAPAVDPTYLPTTYLGIARDLHDWASIDGQFWIAIGTHLKLYVVNQATLYDITPDRKTSNVMNALTTTNASNVVTVVDPGHQANTGDFVDITGATAVGGVTVNGDYQIVVVDPSSYTILAASNATSGATGGGSFSITYEIPAGLPANGELLGYGTYLYGALTYGTPRPVGTGVFARMRTWSLDNYGQDLIASQSDGEIYWWQKNSGPNSPAAIIPAAPQGCQRVLVDAQQRVIIALGCTDVTSTYDAMLIRWCSFDDITDWVPTDQNTAGDDLLTAGSRIITGLKTKGQNLIFTDTTLYRMVFVGSPDIYDVIPAGQVTIVGPNAAVDVDGVAYMMGFDNIYNYSGTLNLQSCDVWETVFDPNVPTSLDRTQSEGVVTYTYEPKTEITWLYPSIGGKFTVTFTAGIAQGATSATLATPWTGETGLYNLQFADQEAQVVVLTKNQTTATWGLPLTAAVAGTATSIGNDRYVTFNWEDGTWYAGGWYRTCAQGRAPAMNGYPYGVNAGYLYQHEIGTDAVEASGTNAIGWFMKSLDITIGGAKSEYTMGGSDSRFVVGGSDAHLLLRSMLPDWVYMTGEMNLTVSTKDRPQDPSYVVSGPVAFSESTDQIDIDAHGSQLVIQLDNFTAGGGEPSLGSSFRAGIFQGLATPYAKR